MAVSASSDQLGCGRDIDRVWDHLDRAPDAHERACAYCRGARADLAGLAQATKAMRDDDESGPDHEPDPKVLDRILSIARAEVRRGRRLPLDRPEDGVHTNTVSEQAVTAVIRRTGDLNPHIQIRRCTVTSNVTAPAGVDRLDGPPVDLDVHAAPVSVSLRVSVAADAAIADTSNQLRRAIIEAVAYEVGMRVSSVHVAVEDVHDA